MRSFFIIIRQLPEEERVQVSKLAKSLFTPAVAKSLAPLELSVSYSWKVALIDLISKIPVDEREQHVEKVLNALNAFPNESSPLQLLQDHPCFLEEEDDWNDQNF